MGMSMNTSGHSRRGRRSYGAKAEMNLTPLIDVMVVLLIIFMITAPLMTVTVPVNLPQVGKGVTSDDSEPLVISISKDNKIYLMDTPVELPELITKLQAVTAQKPDQRLFIRGDQTLSYGTIMQIMGQLTAAGFTKVGLVAETGK